MIAADEAQYNGDGKGEKVVVAGKKYIRHVYAYSTRGVLTALAGTDNSGAQEADGSSAGTAHTTPALFNAVDTGNIEADGSVATSTDQTEVWSILTTQNPTYSKRPFKDKD